MRFSPSFLDDIRARLPISAVVGQRVAWDRRKTQPSRGDWWACCPFHGEKTPSFHADDRKGIYHCFGCGVTGDHFRFLTELDGISFPEAVERLAADAGLALPAPDPADAEQERKRGSLYDALEAAAAYFAATLAGRDGVAARAYLVRRRLGPDAQSRFRLGYASPARNGLKEYLAAKGFAQEQMIDAGLLIAGEDIPVSYDRFRDRVMFPILDLRGRVVAFGGRAMAADAQAKYLNSPETPLFRKGALLYNAADAGRAARRAGRVIAVEGYVDVIALAMAGFPETVAPLGTAVTEAQLALLWRMAPEPILCFDGDAAGIKAAERVIDVALPLLTAGHSLRFALLPEGQDPDDLIGGAGPEAMRTVLDAARPLVDMIWLRETRSGAFDTPERRAALEHRVGAIARSVADPMVRKHYEQALRERVNALFALRAAAGPAARRFAPNRPGATQGRFGGQPGRFGSQGRFGQPGFGAAPGRPAVSDLLQRSVAAASAAPPLRESVLVMTIANHPALLAEHLDIFAALDLSHRAAEGLRREILALAGDSPGLAAATLAEGLRARGQAAALDRIAGQVARSRHWQAQPDADDADAEQGWLQALALHRKARTLHKELRDAEAALSADPSDDNLARMIEIQNQLASAEGAEAILDGFGAPARRV